MATIRKRGDKWYCDFRINGERIRKSLGRDRRAAQIKANELETKYERNQAQMTALGHSFQEALEQYQDHMNVRLKPTTVKKNLSAINMIRDHCGLDDVTDVSSKKINEFITHAMKDKTSSGRRKLGSRTMNVYIGALNGFMQFCVEANYIIENPLIGVLKIKPKAVRDKRAFTDEETTAYLNECNPWLKAISLGMFYSGLRRAEATNLTWDEVDLKNGLIRLKDAKTENCDVWMSLEMRGLLEGLVLDAEGNLVFPNRFGRPYKNNLLRDFRSALRRAGIDQAKLDIHSMRRTFITQHVLKGTHPKLLQKLARHKHFALTMDTYAKIRSEDVRQAAQKRLFGHNMGTDKIHGPTLYRKNG